MTPGLDPTLRRRLLLLAGLLFTLWASWKVGSGDGTDQSATVEPAPVQRRLPGPASAAAPALPLAWPQQPDPRRPVADLFSLPLPPAPISQTVTAVPSPPLPVFRLKYMGRLDGIGAGSVFLTDATDRVISVKVGQAVGDDWVFAAMDARQLVFRHGPTGQEQKISIGALQ